MNVAIAARQCTVQDAVLRRAEERIRNLTRFEPRLTFAELTFHLDGAHHRIEARLTVSGGRPVVARASGRAFGEALDRIVDRVRRQLKSERERRVDHRAPPLPEAVAPAGGD